MKLLLALLLALTLSAHAQPQRPPITGIDSAGFYVSSLPRSLSFWHDLLGYDQSFPIPTPDAAPLPVTFIQINALQHIELFTSPPPAPPSLFHHLAFATPAAGRLRDFLRAHGISVPAGPIPHTLTGDLAFEIKDPNGAAIQFVQRLPSGLQARTAARFVPSTRISPRIYHVGYLVGDAAKTIAFYHLLGFTETWRGAADAGPSAPKELSWINLRVPDGTDYVELMLYSRPPSAADLGSRNHVSLAVDDIDHALATLQSRSAARTYLRPMTIKTGVNQKRQLNLFDPDGTRVELMEPRTLTGQPTSSSTAPLPSPN